VRTAVAGTGDALPPGYVQARSPAATWMVSLECASSVEQGQADFLLAGWGRRATRAGSGRGRMARFRLGGQRVVGKRAMHGGVLGRLLGSLYVGEGRGLSQIPMAERLRHAGIPTPEILAVGSRRALGLFQTQAIVTREITGALNLYEAANEEAAGHRRRFLLQASAELVRALHDVGFLHADLNVTNLVLGRGPEGERLHVVDLEKGRFVVRADVPARFKDLARLVRSYEKWIADRLRLSPREELIFLRRYCLSDRALFRDLAGRLQRFRGRLWARRLAWKHLPSRRSWLLPEGRRE
jgi:tRNA A-37 threonylcarbamoyl transferase component Bud32